MGIRYECVVCRKALTVPLGEYQLPKHKHKDYPLMDCIGLIGYYLGPSYR